MGAKVTSGAGGGARASVKSVLIGAVPDRGGRAEGREAQSIANMPAFSARKAGPAGPTGSSCALLLTFSAAASLLKALYDG